MPLNLLVADLLRQARSPKSREAGPRGRRAETEAVEPALTPPAAPSEAAESTHIPLSQMRRSPVRCSTGGETGGKGGKRRPTASAKGTRKPEELGALPQLCCLRGKAALRDLQSKT